MEALLNILPIIQIALAVILTGAILLQQRGAGLGGAFGGADGGVHYERRGFERTLFKATIAIAVLFVASVMISVIYSPQTEIDTLGKTSTSTSATSTAATTSDNVPVTLEDITIETGSGENIENLKNIPININEDAEPE